MPPNRLPHAGHDRSPLDPISLGPQSIPFATCSQDEPWFSFPQRLSCPEPATTWPDEAWTCQAPKLPPTRPQPGNSGPVRPGAHRRRGLGDCIPSTPPPPPLHLSGTIEFVRPSDKQCGLEGGLTEAAAGRGAFREVWEFPSARSRTWVLDAEVHFTRLDLPNDRSRQRQ